MVLLLAALSALGLVQGGADAGLRARYTKQEVDIPMRDGVTLFTIVYAPVDASRAVPILMTRSPYGSDPYGPEAYRRSLGPSAAFEKDGYIFVYQDVRGRFRSGGEFVEMRPTQVSPGPTDVDESTDTSDTIAWLLSSGLRHNGRVGLWGVSYGGFYAAAALPRAHPALKAVSPQAPIADLFLGDDSYHNGAFMLAANFNFYTSFFPRRGGPSAKDDRSPFTYGTQDGYAFYLGLGGLREGSAARLPGNTYWEDNLAHPTYDAFWQARAIAPHLRDVTPAVLTVGGWYDAEDLAGPLRIYRAIERQSPSASNRLVMGPWAHGGWSRGDGDRLGALAFGAQDQRRVPRALRAAVLRAPPARRPARGRAGSRGLRDRRERVADAAGVAARRRDAPHVLPERGRHHGRCGADWSRRACVRRVRRATQTIATEAASDAPAIARLGTPR